MQQHQELAETLAQYLPEITRFRLHGALTGTACAAWPPREGWSSRLAHVLELDFDQVESLRAEADEALAAAAEALADEELGFEPGVPDGNEMSLESRVDALAEWCDGFLLGYGAADSGEEELQSEECAELLEDISQVLATLEEGLDEGTTEDEDDLEQVNEFLRVAAISLFLEHAEPMDNGDEDPVLH